MNKTSQNGENIPSTSKTSNNTKIIRINFVVKSELETHLKLGKHLVKYFGKKDAKALKSKLYLSLSEKVREKIFFAYLRIIQRTGNIVIVFNYIFFS